MGTIARCAAPNTVLGALVILVGIWRARLRVVEGVLEAHGPTLAWLPAHLVPMSGGVAALTLGHVVLPRDAESLETTRAQNACTFAHVKSRDRYSYPPTLRRV